MGILHMHTQTHIYNIEILGICICMLSPFSCVQLLCDSMDCSLPDSSVHGIFQGKNTGLGCHSLLQGIFLTQGSDPQCFLHVRQHQWILYCWVTQKAYMCIYTYMNTNMCMKEKRVTEDEMIEWHHWFNGHELGQTPGNSEGQGGLACCSPWGRKKSDMT